MTSSQIDAIAEPWKDAFRGEPLPRVKSPYPPKLYSSEYKSPDFYKTKHGERFLGFWPDGRITLCEHDQHNDLCRTVDGQVFTPGGKYGGPTWIMPVEIDSHAVLNGDSV